MIRAVGNKRLDLSNDEFEYYKSLIEIIDKSEFSNIFSTDKNGIIQSVMPDPDKNVSLVVYFFLMNVSFNQRLRKLSSFVGNIEELNEKVEYLENKVKELENKGE